MLLTEVLQILDKLLTKLSGMQIRAHTRATASPGTMASGKMCNCCSMSFNKAMVASTIYVCPALPDINTRWAADLAMRGQGLQS